MSHIEHHPTDETLASYAAGALPAALALVVGCHLEVCNRCRGAQHQLETLGGSLLAGITPQSMSDRARENMLARLDEQEQLDQDSEDMASPAPQSKEVPALLQRLTGADSLDALPWKTVAPGVRQVVLHTGEGDSRLLRIGAGKKMPEHGHRGTELTLILRGGYRDKLGKFNAGDVADLNVEIEHQPVADDDQDCICLAGMDDKLKFRGWIARMMQPFVGI